MFFAVFELNDQSSCRGKIEIPLRDCSKMPVKVAIKNDYQNNKSKGSQSASSVTTEKPEEDNLRHKPKDSTCKTNRDLNGTEKSKCQKAKRRNFVMNTTRI